MSFTDNEKKTTFLPLNLTINQKFYDAVYKEKNVICNLEKVNSNSKVSDYKTGHLSKTIITIRCNLQLWEDSDVYCKLDANSFVFGVFV